MFYFYVFGFFFGIIFLIGFFYFVFSVFKFKYKSKLGVVIVRVCCICGGLLYVLILVIMGFIFFFYSNFLFWLIQDLNGKEIIMGVCIFIVSFFELVVFVFSFRLVKVFGNGGMISVFLFCLVGRLLYYFYFWTLWVVFFVEVFYVVIYIMMWFVVLSNKLFRVSLIIDRVIRFFLFFVYFGVGFGVGSIIFGIMYDQYGFSILFRGFLILFIGWCFVFFLLQRCCQLREDNEIKYSCLFQFDDYLDDDMEDDWLEYVFKDK